MSVLSETIERLGTSYAVTHRAKSTVRGGRELKGAETTEYVTAMVQPLKGDEIERLPEGMRGKDLRVVYSSSELRTQGSTWLSDLISIGDQTYEVSSLEDWSTHGGYWKAIVSRQA